MDNNTHNKANRFLQWLMSEPVRFPFMQDLPDVPMPETDDGGHVEDPESHEGRAWRQKEA